MSIDTYIYNEKFDINIFKRHIKDNKPCLIKNFFINNTKEDNLFCDKKNIRNINIDSKYTTCNIKSLVNHIEKSELKCFGYGCYFKKKENICCSNSLLEKLFIDQEYYFDKDNRLWNHKKKNFTRNHYDGNGVEVINISLKGKKRFYLASPSKTFTMFPISNISVNSNPDDYNYDYIIDLLPGDFLYIPSYWWHKVLTLEDSINMNFNFYVKDHKLSERQKNIYYLHKLANSYLWKNDEIKKFVKFETVTSKSIIKILLSECLILILLSLVSGYFISKYGFSYIFLGLLILNFVKHFNEKFSYGYVTTILHFMIPLFILGGIIGIKYKTIKNYKEL
jgi:hypothetical protein